MTLKYVPDLTDMLDSLTDEGFENIKELNVKITDDGYTLTVIRHNKNEVQTELEQPKKTALLEDDVKRLENIVAVLEKQEKRFTNLRNRIEILEKLNKVY